MEAEEKWFYVWLSIFTIILGTAPFAYWQGYHVSGVVFAIAGIGGLLMLVRDRLATTVNKWLIRVSLKVLAVVTLSLLVGSLIAREITDYRANQEISSVQWWLYGLTILLVAVVISATLSRSKPSKLVIHSADYRAIGDGGQTYDVAEFLRKIICGDSLVFDIENHTFVVGGRNFVPNDPKTGWVKRLRVEYSYSGGPVCAIERYEHDRLFLPEDSEIPRLQTELSSLQAKYSAEKVTDLNEKAKAENEARELEKKVLALEQNSVSELSSLQKDAIELSGELLKFLKRFGPPPLPKYSASEIDNMSSAQMKALIQANNGDFLEACEYYRPGGISFSPAQLESQLVSHMKRLFPWYQKVSSGYALELKGKVETMRHRFAVEEIQADLLLSPVEGRDGEKNIRLIAAKLWELAFEVGAKGSA